MRNLLPNMAYLPCDQLLLRPIVFAVFVVVVVAVVVVVVVVVVQ